LPQGAAGLLLGESGCGKSSLLQVLSGLARPASGEVWVADVPVHALREREADRFRARHIGLVLQQPHLLKPLSVEENLRAASLFAGLRPSEGTADRLLADLGISHLKKQPARTLSVGQAQRVAIARALLHRPRVLLADEPTASLDDRHAEAVTALLLEQSARIGATLLVATHDQRVKALLPHASVLRLAPADPPI
jgi:putative ABC transport system ATP-binding protein